MSVLNQKMDEQMPYFKRVRRRGGEGQTKSVGRGAGAWGVTHAAAATAETETETETGTAQGVLQVQCRRQ